MAFEALRCRLPASGSGAMVVDVWTGDAAALAAKRPDAPVAFLFPAGAIPALLATGGGLVDRRRKHAARGLARYLLRQPGVPVVDAAFTSAGQAIRSVRTVLQRALDLGERQTYLVGVGPRVLDELRARATTSGLFGDLTWAAPAGAAALVSAAAAEDAPAHETVRPLLDDVDVPEALERQLVGSTPRLQDARRWIALAARHGEPVLILGETGTGKEIAAWAIHDLDAGRRVHPFRPVNCAAIPADLFEADLFGYVPGAFTDARRAGSPGLWRSAGRGTLFLDEVGDLALHHQAKILRALEEGRIRPVGGADEVAVHCRVIAATNRDLYAMVGAGQFREDLYYRLRPFLIRMPPLRECRADVPVLARFFWQQLAPGRAPLPGAVLAALAQFAWPGNARELRAVLVGLATMFPGVAPRLEHLRAVIELQSPTRLDAAALGPADEARLHRAECLRHLRRADELIRACKVACRPLGARAPAPGAAERLRATLDRRLAELGRLTDQPLLFHSIATAQAVHRLAGELTIFRDLVDRDPSGAARRWRAQVRPLLAGTLTAIVGEVERLLRHL